MRQFFAVRRLLAVNAVLVLLLGVACGPSTSPTLVPSVEGKIAQSGRHVMVATSSVIDTIDSLVKTDALTKEDAVRILTVLKRVGEEGERLSKVLAVVDQEKDPVLKSKGVDQAVASMKAIQRLVLEAGSDIGSSGSRAKISAALATISDAVLSLALLMQPAR